MLVNPVWYITLTHSSPLCLLACRAATKDRHSCLFWASRCIEFQLWSSDFISFSTVLRQVVLGRPLFLFPSGVQWRAVLVMLPCSLRMTCPIHLHLLRIMMVSILSWLHWVSSSWLDIVFGQNIFRILLRFLVWKVDNLSRSLCVVLQHSKPYSRVDSTQL